MGYRGAETRDNSSERSSAGNFRAVPTRGIVSLSAGAAWGWYPETLLPLLRFGRSIAVRRAI